MAFFPIIRSSCTWFSLTRNLVCEFSYQYYILSVYMRLKSGDGVTIIKLCMCLQWGPGGGVLTDKWYTGMLKGFEVHFRKFWYIDGWVIVTYPMRPICKIGCILENLAKKAPNFAPNWVLFAEKWYRDGSQNHAFRGIEMVEILNSTLSIPVRIFLKNPPPPGVGPHTNIDICAVSQDRSWRFI